MNAYINKILFLFSFIILLGCSDRSQIEGLVFSDEIRVTNVDKDIAVANNSSQNYAGTIRINDTDYSYIVSYYKIIYTDGTIQQYLVSFQANAPLGVNKSNGGAIYNFPEGANINKDLGYFSSSFPIINYFNNINNAPNTVKLDTPFYIGFNVGGNTEFASYGWIKMMIAKDKITIISYGYKTGSSINAGES